MVFKKWYIILRSWYKYIYDHICIIGLHICTDSCKLLHVYIGTSKSITFKIYTCADDVPPLLDISSHLAMERICSVCCTGKVSLTCSLPIPSHVGPQAEQSRLQLFFLWGKLLVEALHADVLHNYSGHFWFDKKHFSHVWFVQGGCNIYRGLVHHSSSSCR